MIAGRDLRACFEDELAYLRELGAEFARLHPEAAHLLSGTSADPSVERLLQGFAFLTARIRRRMDDDLAELAQPLLRLLCPGWLRPVPSLVVQAFAPRVEGTTLRVPAGTRVRSAPVRLDDVTPPVPCEFVTSWDVTVPPVRLVEARVGAGGRHGALHLAFALTTGGTLADLVREPFATLRLHVHDADLPFASAVVRHLVHADVGAPPVVVEAGRRRVAVPRPAPVGFETGEAVVPDGDDGGSALLRELFVFPAKFLFVDLRGLDVLPTLGANDRFSVIVPFSGPFPDGARVRAEHFVLGCTPARNEFEQAGHPFQRLPLRPEYPLFPSGRPHDALEVLDVLEVTGQRQGELRPTVYAPLHEVLGRVDLARTAWYDVRLRAAGPGEVTRTFVLLSPPARVDRDERLTTRLRCGNGQLPSRLRPGEIASVAGAVPAVTRNLGVPTRSCAPPLGIEALWALLGQLGATGAATRHLGALRALLGSHDLRAASGDVRDAEVHARRMAALRAVEAVPVDRLVPVRSLAGSRVSPAARAVLRGTEIRLTVDGPALDGEGTAWLLGAVLDRVFARRASFHTFTRLVVREAGQRHADLAFPPRLGERELP